MKTLFFALTFVCLATIESATAQNEPKEISRLSFGRLALYYGNGNEQYTLPTPQKNTLGNTFGLELYVAQPYHDPEDGDKFILGWCWNNRVGWNFTQRQLAAFGEDIGIWGSYLLSPDVEVGLQYSPLGYNVYQNMSFWGSKIQPAVRWKRLQLTYTREGWGAFYGCIVSKEKTASNVNSIELLCNPTYPLMVSARLTSYKFGNGTTREFTFGIGINVSATIKQH